MDNHLRSINPADVTFIITRSEHGTDDLPFVQITVALGGQLRLVADYVAEDMIAMIGDAAGFEHVGPWLTLGDVAAGFGVLPQTARRWRSQGHLPPADWIDGTRPKWRPATMRLFKLQLEMAADSP